MRIFVLVVFWLTALSVVTNLFSLCAPDYPAHERRTSVAAVLVAGVLAVWAAWLLWGGA